MLWYERPTGKGFLLSSIPIVLFGIPWTAFSLFWEGMALWGAMHAGKQIIFGIVMSLWGIPFVLIGFAMLGSPYFALRQARKLLYVITNQRALELTVGGGVKVKSFYAADVTVIETKHSDSGLGYVNFAFGKDSDGDKVVTGGFMGIRDTANCENLLRRLKDSAESERRSESEQKSGGFSW